MPRDVACTGRCGSRRGGDGWRDAGQVQPSSAIEGTSVEGPLDVRWCQPRCRRTGPVVVDRRRPEAPPLAEHHAGGRIGIRREVTDIDAFAAQPMGDRGPEPVRPDTSDVRDPVIEPGQADRHVRFGPRDVALEVDRAAQRPRGPGDERRQAFAQREDLCGGSRLHVAIMTDLQHAARFAHAC